MNSKNCFVLLIQNIEDVSALALVVEDYSRRAIYNRLPVSLSNSLARLNKQIKAWLELAESDGQNEELLNNYEWIEANSNLLTRQLSLMTQNFKLPPSSWFELSAALNSLKTALRVAAFIMYNEK